MNKKLLSGIILAAILPICATDWGVKFHDSFIENFDGNQPRNLEHFRFDGGGSKVEWQTKIEDGILKIAMNPADTAGAWQGPNYASKDFTHYGRYSLRVRIPCAKSQPNVGAVVGFYTYYNDQWGTELPEDINGNGLFDNSEIDIEWLIADPQIIYLTAWTDYDERNGTRFGKIGRIINMATGQIHSTRFEHTWGVGVNLTGEAENSPATIRAIPNFDASRDFYTYGFDWRPDNIRWWIINPEDEKDTIVLWDYKGPKERITQKPARYSFNFWHTNNWPVVGKPNSTQAPTDTFWVEFDWIKYEKLTDIPTSIENNRRNDSRRNNRRTQANILSVQRFSQNTLIKFDDLKNAEISIYSPNGRRLFHSPITASEILVPNFRQKTILQITQNGSAIYRAVW